MEEQAQFICEAFSFSKVSYKWERNNGLLPDKAIIDTCSSTLTIPNGTQFDEGDYCCVATNECGRVKECAMLSVIGMNDMCTACLMHTHSYLHAHLHAHVYKNTHKAYRQLAINIYTSTSGKFMAMYLPI